MYDRRIKEKIKGCGAHVRDFIDIKAVEMYSSYEHPTT